MKKPLQVFRFATVPNGGVGIQRIGCWVLTLLVLGGGALCAAEPVDFARDIKPVFAKHCLSCHGADKQEGGLRLDQSVSGLKGGDNFGQAILPGKGEDSPLFQFIARDDADLKMPPRGPRLLAREQEVIRLWIDQGAKWPAETDDDPAVDPTQKHWSLQPVQRPALPTGPGITPQTGAIDAFLLEKLAEKELSFSPRAERATLIRRLYFVMLGLPPTPAEVAVFVENGSPTAWAELVDRVLASPRYGERWAQHWLDLVRFGETNGFETNRERTTAWPYRDYVIDAFNSDKPYDQFVREQVAGDALGVDVATGFLVAGPYDLVKSQDINLTLMQRQDELGDIINTTGTTFLGLTIGCARCHNHKFDPISQKDYYALQAVFAGVQHGDRTLAPSPLQAERLAELQAQAVELARALRPYRVLAQPQALKVGEARRWRAAPRAQINVDQIAPIPAKIVRFTVLETNGAEPCLDELAIFSDEQNIGLASAGAVARCSSALPGYPIHKLAHINDGHIGNSHSWISNEPGTGWIEIELPAVRTIDSIEWGRDQQGKFPDRVPTKYRIDVAVTPGEWTTVASSEDRLPFGTAAAEHPRHRFEGQYDWEHAPVAEAEQGQRLVEQLERVQSSIAQLTATRAVYTGKFETPAVIHRLFRGDPLAPKEVVGPETITVLGSLGLAEQAPEQARRVALANWLAQPENPLTARVWVNRLWQFHFGRGLVETPSDFGKAGIAPTHPELLDWLASELIQHGWSTKQMHRLILLSQAWQQDSRPQAAGLARDGAGQLLWRFTPRRLEAEAIHDHMLAVSGVLNLTMGGPGYDGFEVQYENVRHYFPKQTFGPADYRRMIYMTKVRMEKEATFGAFDCPDASQVVPRRSQSTTPLQALNLLNSPYVRHQAELLTQRLEQAPTTTTQEQVQTAYRLCYGRAATPQEVQLATEFIAAEGLLQFCRAVFNSNEFLFIP